MRRAGAEPANTNGRRHQGWVAHTVKGRLYRWGGLVITESTDESAAPLFLFKYVSDDRALTCLPDGGSGTLRATQPAALNDPFECHQKLDVFFVAPDPNARLALGLTELHTRVPVTSQEVADALRLYGSLYVRDLLTKQLSRRCGIVSFWARSFHPLMWSYYTVGGSGFVIGYETARLRELPGTHLHRVTYSSEPGVWLHYEADARADPHAILTVGLGRNDQYGHPINLLHVPNAAVAKVYYTERTPTKSVKEIERRLASANNRYGTQQLTKLVLSPWTYAYVEAGTEGRMPSRQEFKAALRGLRGEPPVADPA